MYYYYYYYYYFLGDSFGESFWWWLSLQDIFYLEWRQLQTWAQHCIVHYNSIYFVLDFKKKPDDDISNGTEHKFAKQKFPQIILLRDLSSDTLSLFLGRGAYDTTGVPKPPIEKRNKAHKVGFDVLLHVSHFTARLYM